MQSRKAEDGLQGQMPLTQNPLQVTLEGDAGFASIQTSVFQDKEQQKTAVRERLERLRRERSCVVQSKRDR